jgi:Ca2+-binding EF-hand superfamily protein
MASVLLIVERALIGSLFVASIAWTLRRAPPLSSTPEPFTFDIHEDSPKVHTVKQHAASNLYLDDHNARLRTRSRAKEVFANLGDEEGTGLKGFAELATYMRLAGANPSEAEVDQYTRLLRHSGERGFTARSLGDVLESFYREHPPEERREELSDTFLMLDVDGDGVLRDAEIADLEHMLTHLGEPLSEEELREFLVGLDEDGDHALTRDEFMGGLLDDDDDRADARSPGDRGSEPA